MTYEPMLVSKSEAVKLAAMLQPARADEIRQDEVWHGIDATSRFAIGAVLFDAFEMRGTVQSSAFKSWYDKNPLEIASVREVDGSSSHLKLSELYDWFDSKGGCLGAASSVAHHHLSIRRKGRQPMPAQREVDQLLVQIALRSGASITLPPKSYRAKSRDPYPQRGFITFVSSAYKLISDLGSNTIYSSGVIGDPSGLNDDPRVSRALRVFGEWYVFNLPGLAKRMDTAKAFIQI